MQNFKRRIYLSHRIVFMVNTHNFQTWLLDLTLTLLKIVYKFFISEREKMVKSPPLTPQVQFYKWIVIFTRGNFLDRNNKSNARPWKIYHVSRRNLKPFVQTGPCAKLFSIMYGLTCLSNWLYNWKRLFSVVYIQLIKRRPNGFVKSLLPGCINHNPLNVTSPRWNSYLYVEAICPVLRDRNLLKNFTL